MIIFLHSHHLFAWCCIDICWEIGLENFPFISSSDPIKFKTWNNQDLMTGIFQHLILLHFTMSSYWLPVIFSFVLIGHYHNSNKKSSYLKKKKNTQIVHVPISSCLLVVHSLTKSSGMTPSTTLDLLVNLNQQ